jgi:K+-transporting ATPase KdpF subunit
MNEENRVNTLDLNIKLDEIKIIFIKSLYFPLNILHHTYILICNFVIKKTMTTEYLIGLIVSFFLMVYLCLVIFKPEKF